MSSNLIASSAELSTQVNQQQLTVHTSSAGTHANPVPQAESASEIDLDRRFNLAVSISATAILLPIVSTLLNPIARDSLTFLDAAIWLISVISVFSLDYYNSRSRLFRNGLLAAFVYGTLMFATRTSLSDAHMYLPLAVNIAIVINAQDMPWTCIHPWRSHSDVLPFYNSRGGGTQ